MAGKKSRNKGRRLEQELVRILKSRGVPAKRISMMESGGLDKGDIQVAGIWKAEVKGGEQVPKFLYTARKGDEEFLFLKRDRMPWLVTMDLTWFLDKFM